MKPSDVDREITNREAFFSFLGEKACSISLKYCSHSVYWKEENVLMEDGTRGDVWQFIEVYGTEREAVSVAKAFDFLGKIGIIGRN